MAESKAFEGMTVGLFETRRQRELSAMFAARGAIVVPCPLIFPESRGVEEPVRKFIEEALGGKFAFVIFYTGLGIQAVLDAARELGQYGALKGALAHMTVIARGPKGKGALRRHGLAPNFLAEPPTTQGLIKLAEGLELKGQRVAVALAGDQPNLALAEAVERKGGAVYEFAPYHYKLPDDLSEVEAFIQKVVSGEIGVLVFTTPPQVTILLEVAEKLGRRQELVDAMQASLVAAVGSVTAATLDRYGVRVTARPPAANETMMGLVQAVQDSLGRP
jgi:uroporphyrinogen-III synthase